MNIPDDPIIRNIERNGYYSRWGYSEEPRCPVCGSECGTVYKDSEGEIFGCDNCLTECDAWETEECFPNRGREW